MNNSKIWLSSPHMGGTEQKHIQEAFDANWVAPLGPNVNGLEQDLENYLGNQAHVGALSSGTAAIHLGLILLGVQAGDEVIMPSYTFVSTANAFILRGAKIIFADSRTDHPGIDEMKLEALITAKTKVIVPVHYAGTSCDMDFIMELAAKYNLFVVEDAAQAIDNYYIGRDGKKKALGSIGHLAAFSFHETKNIISGEGGMLVINDSQFKERAEIIWEKGTNRSAFFKGEVDKYGWVDIGSSFLPSAFPPPPQFSILKSVSFIFQRNESRCNFNFSRSLSIRQSSILQYNLRPIWVHLPNK